jgi:hypothetical protein
MYQTCTYIGEYALIESLIIFLDIDAIDRSNIEEFGHFHARFFSAGELKKALVADTGLQPEQQRVLYKGKERKDRDALSEAGVKDKSKLVLVEDKVGWEKKLLELRKEEAMVKARKSVAQVQALVDKVSGQVGKFFVFRGHCRCMFIYRYTYRFRKCMFILK